MSKESHLDYGRTFQLRSTLTELKILIAASSSILRTRLRTAITQDQHRVQVHEVATMKGLQMHLSSKSLDFLVISQAFMTDLTDLPRGRFVVVAAELDLDILRKAYKHGARGYLQNTSAELLHATLYLENGAFLIEPTFVPYTMDFFVHGLRFMIQDELLSPREREIAELLRDGIDRRTIARQLCISETTLKTHIQHMKQKSDSYSRKTREAIR